ncbi:MAG: hypothetical protein JEZ03_15545 [Bacteroidales bacterium]|nr:hypothetical protein [Bacteroidales bacterium]
MKHIIALCIILLLLPAILWAQVDIEKTKAPGSPASSILEMQPSGILQPKSYKALETALFSNYVNNQGSISIPNDFMIEFSPYWAKDPKLDIEQYLFPNPWESLVRNASFSLASTQNYYLGDSTKSKALGFGFRSTLVISTNKEKERLAKQLETIYNTKDLKNLMYMYARMSLRKQSESKDKFIGQYLKDLKAKDSTLNHITHFTVNEKSLDELSSLLHKQLPEYNSQQKNDFLQIVNNVLDQYLKTIETRENIELLIGNRPGFKLDVAAALSLDFPTNEFNLSEVPQQSIWLTPSYSFSGEKSNIEVLGVMRYNYHNSNFYEKYFPQKVFNQHSFDYGLGLSIVYQKFSLLFEVEGRRSREVLESVSGADGIVNQRIRYDSDLQYIGSFNYQLSDKLMLTYKLGKKFEPVINYDGTLISLLSLNFGIGGPTKENISAKQ